MDFNNFDSGNTQPTALVTSNIPKITTRETDKLRDQYPSLSHLEGGNIAEWLQERKDQLFEQARAAENEADTTRVLGLAASGIGLVCYAVNPFMVLGGMVGGAAWLWLLVDHYNRTKEIAPLPFVRGNFLDAIARAGDYDARQNYRANHLADTIKFLPRHHAEEYTFIYSDCNFETITQYLQQVDPGKRFYAYRWLFGWFVKLKGKQIPTQETMAEHLQHVTVDSRVKVEEVKTIVQSNEQFQLPETKTVDIRQFDLPKVNVLRPTPEQKLIDEETGDSTKIVEIESNPVKDSSHKHQWIKQILKLPFRVISGEQGSGKSTLERWMISLLKDAGYYVVVVNPETNPSVWYGVSVLSTASEINEFFGEFIESVRDRQHEARVNGIDEDDYFDFVKQRKGKDGLVAIFLMESNTYEVHGVDPTLWADFLKQCLTNIRKWGFTACLTAHSDNQTSIASKLKGFSSLLDAQPRIDCITKADPTTGEATSSGKGLLKMKGTNDSNPLTINLVNYPKTKDFRTEKEKEKSPLQAEPKTTISDVIHNLENTFKLESTQISDSPEVHSIKNSNYSVAAKLLLSFFDNVKIKNPKSLKELKDANKLRQLDSDMLLMALRELVVEEQITFDAEGRYLKPEWE